MTNQANTWTEDNTTYRAEYRGSRVWELMALEEDEFVGVGTFSAGRDVNLGDLKLASDNAHA